MRDASTGKLDVTVEASPERQGGNPEDHASNHNVDRKARSYGENSYVIDVTVLRKHDLRDSGRIHATSLLNAGSD